MKSLCNRILKLSLLFIASVPVVRAGSDAIPNPIAQALNVEIVLDQQEIAVPIQSAANAGAQYGLVGAIVTAAIDNEKAKKAEKIVFDIRNLLIDFNFNQSIVDALKAAVRSSGISPSPIIVVHNTALDAAADQQASMDEPKQSVLRIIPRYTLSDNFEMLSVDLQVFYVQKSLKDSGKIIESIDFTRYYGFQFSLKKMPHSGAEEDAARWIDVGKERITTMLEHGVSQVADMLAYDFSAEGRKIAMNPPVSKMTEFEGRKYRGVIRQTPNYIWTASGKSKRRSIIGVQSVPEAASTGISVP